MRRRRVWLETAVTVALLAAGCVGKDPDTDPGPTTIIIAPDASATDSPAVENQNDAALAPATFALTPARPRVRVGGSTDVEVTIDRKGLTGPITLVVGALPNGVTASPVTFAATESKATLKLTAANAATIGAAPFEVGATGADKLAATVVVAGVSGTIDQTFDNDGIFIDPSSATGLYYAVVALAEGSFVVAGATAAGSGNWVIKKYDASGVPDASFNGNTASGLPSSGNARAMARDPSTGKIVVVGDSGGHRALLRLNTNGTLDQTFGSAGIYVANNILDSQGSIAQAVVVQPDSSVVIGGRLAATTGFVQRYTPVAVPDDTFAFYGTPFDGSVNGIARLTNGTFIVGGTRATSPPTQFLARLGVNGAVDGTFGPGGFNAYGEFCSGDGFALASNDDALLVGWSVASPSLCTTRVATSGDGGIVYEQTSSALSTGHLYAVARGAGNTTYAAGDYGGSQTRAGLVERRLPAGGFDPAFGTDGVYTLQDLVNVPDSFRFVFRAVTTTADGQVLLAGSRTGAVSPGAVVVRVWE